MSDSIAERRSAGAATCRIMAAVASWGRHAAIVALAGNAARDAVDRHGETWMITWLNPPREQGLWVQDGELAEGVAHWSGSWRRATAEEATRFAAGERVWA